MSFSCGLSSSWTPCRSCARRLVLASSCMDFPWIFHGILHRILHLCAPEKSPGMIGMGFTGLPVYPFMTFVWYPYFSVARGSVVLWALADWCHWWATPALKSLYNGHVIRAAGKSGCCPIQSDWCDCPHMSTSCDCIRSYAQLWSMWKTVQNCAAARCGNMWKPPEYMASSSHLHPPLPIWSQHLKAICRCQWSLTQCSAESYIQCVCVCLLLGRTRGNTNGILKIFQDDPDFTSSNLARSRNPWEVAQFWKWI